jgi:hypothetical protein
MTIDRLLTIVLRNNGGGSFSPHVGVETLEQSVG